MKSGTSQPSPQLGLEKASFVASPPHVAELERKSRSHELFDHFWATNHANTSNKASAARPLVCCSLVNNRCSAQERKFMSSVESLRHAALAAKHDQLVSRILHICTALSSDIFLITYARYVTNFRCEVIEMLMLTSGLEVARLVAFRRIARVAGSLQHHQR